MTTLFRKAFLFFIFTLNSVLASSALAADLPFDSMSGFPSNKIKIEYSGFNEPVENLNFNRINLRLPAWVSEHDSLIFTVKGSHLSVPHGILIPKSEQIEVPESLSSLEGGLQYIHRLEGERTYGGGFSLGSASDRLFSTSESFAASANVFYSFPSEHNDRWIWALFYSNNSPLFRGLPIPAFAYFFKRSTLMGAVGVPFVFLRWTPVEEPWVFSLMDFATIMKLEAAYGPPVAQYFTGFDWNQQTWHRHESEDRENKLFFDEKKIFVGSRFLLAKLMLTELQIGQAFDRSFYEGQGLGRRDTGTAYLPVSWYISWTGKIEF